MIKKGIFISIAVIIVAGTAVFAYFRTTIKTPTSTTTTIFSKLQELKRSAPFPILIPTYIPEGRHYRIEVPKDGQSNDTVGFSLIPDDPMYPQGTKMDIFQSKIDRQFLIDHNDWDPATGWPRSIAPRIGETPIQVGDHLGYLDTPGENVSLKYKQGDIIIGAYIHSSFPILRSSADSPVLGPLIRDLTAIVASMK